MANQNELPVTPNGAPAAAPAVAPAADPMKIAALPVAPVTAIVPASHAIAAPAGDEPSRALSAFASVSAFETAQRMAKSLSRSSLVPESYRNEQGLPNVLIAMELANRTGASVLMVMQNLDVIHGRPSWRSQFLIATVNSSGRFTPLRFRWEGSPGKDDWGCRAVAKDKADGEPCLGALITMGLAKSEGWTSKNGSKWKTMPEQMLMYRAAAFWVRIYAPELSLGMQTREEVVDTVGVDVPDEPTVATVTSGDPRALEQALMSRGGPAHTSDGEIIEREPGQEG